MIGKTLSHYQILDRVGAGGMGEVYRALDTRLGRHVAVKVVPPGVAKNPGMRARFEREARAVAALSHANILAIFDFGFEDDIGFAVTELLEGETLRAVLTRAGAVPADKALDYAEQIIRGLVVTHEKGIVHRDLKPENLFVTGDGTVKILDFGLAKVADPESTPAHTKAPTLLALTEPGTVLGTVSYMSPEQVKGFSVGYESDLFSFGVILYEMITGENPFRHVSSAETMSAILRDEPKRIEETATSVPDELVSVVRHCLKKNPAERPGSAADIGVRLKSCRLDAPASAGSTKGESVDSLAVLPFVNESADPEVDYLSEGITDSLIDNLCQLPRLKVMARSTVFQYQDRISDPKGVGESLGVRAVLTGRLRLYAERLVVRAELVDVADGTRLWGRHFKRPVTDLLEIEDEIAWEISENLRLKLNNEEKARLTKRHTQDPGAHQAYLQGRFVWNKWKTPDGMKTAIGFFERARAIDPLYARAFAGLADSYSMLGNVKALPPEEAYPRAKTAAEQGLAIDDSVAELHTSLAFVHRFWDWDWTKAEGAFQRAISLNPGYATAYRWYAQLLSGLGRHEKAIETGRKALELDPLSLIIRGSVGDLFFYARRYDEAIDHYRETIEMDPQFLAGHTDLARSYELAGRYDEAVAEFRTAATLAPKGPPEPSSGLAHVYAEMGEHEKAREIAAELIELRSRRYVSPYGIASIHACLGEVDTAFQWLEQAYSEHDQTLVWVKVHPRLDPLRGDPRFADLLRRMKL